MLQAKKKTKKVKRLVLQNSLKLATKEDNKSNNKQVILDLLSMKLQKLYPPQVSTTVALASLSKNEKEVLLKLPKMERVGKIKELKAEKRSTVKAESKLLPVDVREEIVLGMKKVLRALQDDSLTSLVYDNSVAFDALQSLFDKGKIPMIGLPELSNESKKSLGFPALAIGFRKDQRTGHFQDVIDMLDSCKVTHKSNVVLKNNQEKPVEAVKTKPSSKSSKKKLAKVEVKVLTRPSHDRHARAFNPEAAPDQTKKKSKTVKQDFGADFLRFDADDESSNFKPTSVVLQ